MDDFMNKMVDGLSDFLAKYPGLLPLTGIGLVVINFILHLVFPGSTGWFLDSNVLLHLGVIVSILGLLTVRPLG